MFYPRFFNRRHRKKAGICAPSAGVGHKLESFDMSLEALKYKGFNIVETESVRNEGDRSASAAIRGSEFNKLVNTSSVSHILAAAGGDYNIEMLEHIDVEALLAHPKWICGASDPTNILYFVTTKLDIATMYGVNAGSFDWRPLHEFQDNALEILSGNLITQNSFDYYDGCRDFSRDWPELDEEVYWLCSEPWLNVRGRIIGGCLDVITRLIGTGFDGAGDFIERYHEDGIIWYFDVFDMNPAELLMTMYQFKYAGYLDACTTVVFGRVLFTGDFSDDDYINDLYPFFEELGIPFIFNADIGHVKPCMTIINGAIAEIECVDGHGQIRFELI